MAIRAGLATRFLSTISYSQSLLPVASIHASTAVNGNSKPAPSSTLFVAGLNKRTTSKTLHNAFSKFGEVEKAQVVTDRASGYSKGYGFVTYATLEDAAKGIEGMDTQQLDGWIIFVEYARPRTIGQPACQGTDGPTS